jgi:hypothetical protein
MNTRRALCSLVVLFSLRSDVAAQTVPHLPSTVQMTGYDTRGSGVSAQTNSTMLSFSLEGDTTGDTSFEIATSDPGVAVCRFYHPASKRLAPTRRRLDSHSPLSLKEPSRTTKFSRFSR